MADDKYKITDEDVLAMLKYLRLHLPEYATVENALFLLKNQQLHYKNLEQTNPEVIEDILKKLEKG